MGKVSVRPHKGGKLNVSHSSFNNNMKVGTISMAVFAKALIKSQYLVSPGHSIEHYEWRFMPVNMTEVFTSSKASRLGSCCPYTDASTPVKQTCWFLRILKQGIERSITGILKYQQMHVFQH